MPYSIESLGASHLADAGYEIQRTNNFEIQIDGVSKVRPLILSVVSGFLPSESNEVISLNYGNSTVTVAGKANVNGSGSIVVRDFLEEDIEEVIDEWRDKVYSKSDRYDRNKLPGTMGFAADYKKNAYVTQYAPDGTHLRVWKLEGVWPSAVDYGQVSYDSPGVKTINITLQYDSAILDRTHYDKEKVVAQSLDRTNR